MAERRRSSARRRRSAPVAGRGAYDDGLARHQVSVTRGGVVTTVSTTYPARHLAKYQDGALAGLRRQLLALGGDAEGEAADGSPSACGSQRTIKRRLQRKTKKEKERQESAATDEAAASNGETEIEQEEAAPRAAATAPRTSDKTTSQVSIVPPLHPSEEEVRGSVTEEEEGMVLEAAPSVIATRYPGTVDDDDDRGIFERMGGALIARGFRDSDDSYSDDDDDIGSGATSLTGDSDSEPPSTPPPERWAETAKRAAKDIAPTPPRATSSVTDRCKDSSLQFSVSELQEWTRQGKKFFTSEAGPSRRTDSAKRRVVVKEKPGEFVNKVAGFFTSKKLAFESDQGGRTGQQEGEG